MYRCKCNTILLKIRHSKIIFIIFIFVIKYSLSYKHISRGHISPLYGHPITNQRAAYGVF